MNDYEATELLRLMALYFTRCTNGTAGDMTCEELASDVAQGMVYTTTEADRHYRQVCTGQEL